jgi:ApbE superfamily uncharacterized protein (UPF0280 family)
MKNAGKRVRMPYEQCITVLYSGAVMAECGPMRMVISAHTGKIPQKEMAIQAAEQSFTYLERVANQKSLLARRFSEMPEDVEDPLVAEMIKSTLAIGDEDLTPMVSVAGTIADAVADFLFARGMTRVVVDNGGDVAVRLRGGDPVRVGIRPEIESQRISHVIYLDPHTPSWGMATSGLGGRSLTRGVASAATVIARKASIADAAATAIANASYVEDEHVMQRLAAEIDPSTDIGGLPVTVKVGPLSGKKKQQALFRAMQKAECLSREGVTIGAFVAVGGRFAMTDAFRQRRIEQVERDRPPNMRNESSPS